MVLIPWAATTDLPAPHDYSQEYIEQNFIDLRNQLDTLNYLHMVVAAKPQAKVYPYSAEDIHAPVYPLLTT